MATPPTPPEPELFEPAEPDFFDRHKSAIFAGCAAVVALIFLAGAFQFVRQARIDRARAEFSVAATAGELRAIIEAGKTPFEANARLLLADRLRGEGDFDAALATLDGFDTRFPRHPLVAQGALNRAAILEEQGKLDEATEAYGALANAHPDAYAAPFALLMRGRLLRIQGQEDEARRVFESAITRYPGTASVQEMIREMDLLAPDAQESAPMSDPSDPSDPSDKAEETTEDSPDT